MYCGQAGGDLVKGSLDGTFKNQQELLRKPGARWHLGLLRPTSIGPGGNEIKSKAESGEGETLTGYYGEPGQPCW